jgi:vacuolar-type H+-ATPase subunit E/Vma4
MGWGTDFNANIFLDKVEINNKYQLDELIRETEEEIQNLREFLLVAAMSNPKMLLASEDNSIYSVINQIKDNLDELQNKSEFLFKLNTLKENKDNFFKNK